MCDAGQKLWMPEGGLEISPGKEPSKPYLPFSPGKVLFNLGTDTILDVLIRSSIARNPGKSANVSRSEGVWAFTEKLCSPFLVRSGDYQADPSGLA